MAFDYKKEFKDYYLPKTTPSLVHVPVMHYVAVDGKGNPNDVNGEYHRALQILYALSYTIKMSYKTGYDIEGYFPYVVPPLEGLWWMADETAPIDYLDKSGFHWTSMIRLPDFVTADILEWAKAEAANKKKIDTGSARFFTYEEGLCVQCMHVGSYDDEPVTIAKMDSFAQQAGCLPDFSSERRHHEIYLGDPRRTAPEKLKTVIRHPVKE